MTVSVARHGVPQVLDEGMLQTMREMLDETVASLESSPRMFSIALNEALGNVQACIGRNPRANLLPTWEATVSSMQVGTAAFEAAAVDEGDVQTRINDELRTIPATGPQFYATGGNWLTALWFVIICRDHERMAQMCAFPLDRLRASGAHGDEYVLHWIDTLQSYWREEPGVVDKLTRTLQTSDPTVAVIAPRALLQNVLYPPINLFFQFLRQDHAAFNKALLEALELHKAYWGAAERAGDTGGNLALGPLAMACLAYDAGFPIEVESDYLPHHLLRRTWVGEFAT